ncbi:MAG: PspC domain-containing protein [Tannerella sp.]|nr:PspC domain-containing protein [Tannerella sp.]
MTEIKRLYRSNGDRMIAGVCAGIAEYFALDPTLVRIGYIVLCLCTAFTAMVAYLVLWIVIPQRKNLYP